MKVPPTLTLTIKPSGGDMDPNKRKEKMDQLVKVIKVALRGYL